MAIIKCPECGAEISSNAGHCVNCGCKITYCPDCNKIFIGEIDVCNGCGHIFKNNDKKDKSFDEQVKKLGEGIDCDKKLTKRISRIQWVIEIISMLIFAIGVIIYVNWAESNLVERLLKLNSVFKSLKVIVVIGCTVSLVSWQLTSMSSSVTTLRSAKRVQDLKFDRSILVESDSLFAGYGKEGDYYSHSLKESFFINENPQIRKWYILPYVVHAVFNIITDICLSVWIIGNVENLLVANVLGETFKLGDIQFVAVPFFCAIAFFISGFVVSLSMISVNDKRLKKWCEENSLN